MKQLYITLLLFLSFQYSQAQMSASEDSLKTIQSTILQQENDSLKKILNEKFIAVLMRALANASSINYPFDSLKTISILTPSDKSFRIYNWEISFSDASIAYFGLIQSMNKKKNAITLTLLSDQSPSIKKPENTALDAKNWYGAHYYKLIETKLKKKKYYTLLGANWSSILLRKKIIDVISIGNDGKPKFGEAIFKSDKIISKRIVFQYAEEVSMSLRYDTNKDMILFDHLSPRSPELKGQYEFYAPDLSVDGYQWKKGKWNYVNDVDARNMGR